MNERDLLKQRLWNTGLSHPRFQSATEAVAHLGAVQAQDYGPAKWAVGLRVASATDDTIEAAINSGAILRTHVLRPTWHFVAPQDIRWMLQLTAPRVKSRMQPYNRKMDLDEKLFAKSKSVISKALQRHGALTRQELKVFLQKAGINADLQRLAHILMEAELDALVCSGPRKDKQNTYALLEERVARTPRLPREDALARLALLYFGSHGPAQLADFCWWSSLTAAEAAEAVELVRPQLDQESIGNKNFWFCPAANGKQVARPASCYLLSIYDEYTIAYRDRSHLSEVRDVERMLKMGNSLTQVIILKSKVAGAWKKQVTNSRLKIELVPFRKFSPSELNAVRLQARRYQQFIGADLLDLKGGPDGPPGSKR